MLDNKKQWYLLILATGWLFIALVLTASIFSITRDPYGLTFTGIIAPPVAMLRLLYRYHFPPSTADYELKKLKIQAKALRKHRGGP